MRDGTDNNRTNRVRRRADAIFLAQIIGRPCTKRLLSIISGGKNERHAKLILKAIQSNSEV
jgi:hypothetical protein